MARWVLVSMVFAVGCSKAPSEEQCKQLLDHLVDLEFKKAGATAGADSQKADLGKQKQAVAEAKWPEFNDACRQKTAKERVECALLANDIDAVAKCDSENQ